MKLKFFFEQFPYEDAVSVYIVAEKPDGEKLIAAPIKLEFNPIENYAKDPCLRLSGPIAREFFPALVEGLARSGYAYESTDKGELKATKKHLEDMRELVFEEPKIINKVVDSND